MSTCPCVWMSIYVHMVWISRCTYAYVYACIWRWHIFARIYIQICVCKCTRHVCIDLRDFGSWLLVPERPKSDAQKNRQIALISFLLLRFSIFVFRQVSGSTNIPSGKLLWVVKVERFQWNERPSCAHATSKVDQCCVQLVSSKLVLAVCYDFSLGLALPWTGFVTWHDFVVELPCWIMITWCSGS